MPLPNDNRLGHLPDVPSISYFISIVLYHSIALWVLDKVQSASNHGLTPPHETSSVFLVSLDTWIFVMYDASSTEGFPPFAGALPYGGQYPVQVW